MVNIDKLKEFEKALANVSKDINKQYYNDDKNKESAIKLYDEEDMQIDRISSGSLVLDTLLGGGFPKGRIIEIYGPEASGKTSIALTAVGNVQKEGGLAAFVDLEHALDPEYAEVLGVDMDTLAVSQPSSAEESLDLVLNLINTEMMDIIVVDSIAAMAPLAELEGTMID